MDRGESSTLTPSVGGKHPRPAPDDPAGEASSPKRRRSAEAVGRVAVSAPGDSEFEDGEVPDEGTAAIDGGRGTEADPGQAGPASGALPPDPSERSNDILVDDIFGASPILVRKLDGCFRIKADAHHDNWDDVHGYYNYRIGELLDGRYEIIAVLGKGVSSNVVRTKDLKAGKNDPDEVAIKIICNNPVMYKAAKKEILILKNLGSADPKNKQHCVGLISNFVYRNHLCLVFESLRMNLREVIKKFGCDVGLKLTAVRAYSKQLFIALKHLRSCGVLHCDIKPDNVLVNGAGNMLKLCDFGSAMPAGTNEITPILVSRFYRAPEIILGLPYGHPLDMWSVGCCLYELYTGKVLFPGKTNNDMLRLHMELKGPFPKKMLRKCSTVLQNEVNKINVLKYVVLIPQGAFTDEHFDQDLNFHAIEKDPMKKMTLKRLFLNNNQEGLGSSVSRFPGEDPKMLSSFKDLLERIFVLDPEKRLNVSQALSHPFISGK
ncbi:hypothetical protein ACP70R_024622 [Stipagrostis hirtigluma subsp. patula]